MTINTKGEVENNIDEEQHKFNKSIKKIQNAQRGHMAMVIHSWEVKLSSHKWKENQLLG